MSLQRFAWGFIFFFAFAIAFFQKESIGNLQKDVVALQNDLKAAQRAHNTLEKEHHMSVVNLQAANSVRNTNDVL